jgi:hypothetical protein
MKLTPSSLFHKRAEVDAVVAAYRNWRCQSAGVRAAYRTWLCGPASDARAAFAAYGAALDREERAADIYAQCLAATRHRPTIVLARQLARLAAESGAM